MALVTHVGLFLSLMVSIAAGAGEAPVGASFVKQTKHLKIFWSGTSQCKDASSVAPTAQNTERAQKLLETELEERLERFETMAQKVLPNWKSQISAKIYPISVVIEPGASAACGSLSATYFDGQIALTTGGIFEDGFFISRKQSRGFISLRLRDVGRLITRALGYPNSGPLRELIPDFITLMANDQDPLIGEGFVTSDQKASCTQMRGLKDAERWRRESYCRMQTGAAFRDYNIPQRYNTIYLHPNYHLTSGVANSLLHRWTVSVGPEAMLKAVMGVFFKMNPSVFDAEINLFMDEVFDELIREKPTYRSKLLHYKEEVGWKPALKSDRSLKIHPLAHQEHSTVIFAEPAPDLYKDLANTPVLLLDLKASRGTLRSVAYFGRAFGSRFQLNKTTSCRDGDRLCHCFGDGEVLKIDAVYLNAGWKVSRTNAQSVLQIGHDVPRGCFNIGVK